MDARDDDAIQGGAQRGRIILLNGASSSGKSSIARAVQAKIEDPFWHISIDHLRDAGVLPTDRFRSGEFKWSDAREAFFNGFEQSLAAYVQSGNSLIVEYIVETEASMRRLIDLLVGGDVFFVGVHCGLGELERRERVRGDRNFGDARRDFHTVHAHCAYDAELDATSFPAEINAEKLLASWRSRKRPSAFDRSQLRSL